jgi:hypothetical protein
VPTSLQFFSHLRWIDGRPLLDTIEPYRREIFTRALDAHRDDGTPEINFVLAGRGKKNYKTADLVLAGLYVLLIRDNIQGTDGFILANDEQQANDDLSLAKKLVPAIRTCLRSCNRWRRKSVVAMVAALCKSCLHMRYGSPPRNRNV